VEDAAARRRRRRPRSRGATERAHGIQGAKRRGKPRRTTTPDPFAQRRPDLVQRDFTASAPNRLWVGDLTYLRCWERVVFFAFILDAYTRRIVGWQFASHMRTELVLDALRMAIHQRGPGADVELVAHTDSGSQYTSTAYTDALAQAGIRASVGSVGDALDNAMAECFVDSFKTELIADRVWRTRSQLELAIVEYVAWFNTTRLHASLDDLLAAEFEALHAPLHQPDPSIPSRMESLGNHEIRSPSNPGRLSRIERMGSLQTTMKRSAPPRQRSRSAAVASFMTSRLDSAMPWKPWWW
jgi:putative transposase